MSHRLARTLASVACIAALAILVAPTPDGMTPQAMRAAAVVTLAIGLWATAVVPEFYTAIIFFFLAATLAAAPPEVVFSGFHSGAVWIIFGGLVIGLAVSATGLGTRIARPLLACFPGSYFGVIAGTVLVAAVLSFLVPSTSGRIMILLPIVLSLADRLGFAVGSRGRSGMTLAVAFGTLHPSYGVLPANVPNLGLLGAAKSIHGIELTYMQWFAAEFPVIGMVSILALPPLIWLIYRDTPRPAAAGTGPATRLAADERNLLIILLLALALWMTDFAHGVSPAWIAIGAAVLCLAPGIGIIPAATLMERINFAPWFFVAAVIGMGAVINASGLGNTLGEALFSVVSLTPGEDARNFAAVNAIGMGVGLIAAFPGQPGIMAALARNIADGTGWPLVTVLLAMVPAWATAIFPYQLPPIVLAMSLGGLRARDAVPLLVAMTVVTWLVILPLQFLWFRYLGMFG